MLLPSLVRLRLSQCTVDTDVVFKRTLETPDDEEWDDEPVFYYHDRKFTNMKIPNDFGNETIEYFRDVSRWKNWNESYIQKYDNVVNVAHERSELLKSIMFGDDVFMFQSLGRSDATVSIARIHKKSVMLTKPNAPGNFGQPREYTAMGMKLQLEARFAWRDRSNERRCGSYNCFFPSFDIANNSEISEFIRALIFKTLPDSSRRYPTAVAVRAPLEPSEFFDRNKRLGELTIEFDELLLTLEMARRALTPPVYGAMPVQYYKTSVDLQFPVQTAFVYFTEAGWTDLGIFIHELPAGTTDAKLSALGDAIVLCCEKTAVAQVVLTDIKTNNMVIKEMQPHVYDVRMIDFGSVFSVILNQLPDEYTSRQCIFFVNALLLLNYSAFRHRRVVFKRLALAAVASWRYMKRVTKLTGFCAFLDVDVTFASRVIPTDKPLESLGKTLQTVEELHRRLAQVFYLVLHTYSLDDELIAIHKAATTGKSYVDVVVENIAKYYDISDSVVDKLVAVMETRPSL